MTKFVIKHQPSNKFAHLTFRGLDALNLGWNPKLYDDRRAAERDYNRLNEAIQHNHNVLNNTEIGTSIHMSKNNKKSNDIMEKVKKERILLDLISPDQFIIEETDKSIV